MLLTLRRSFGFTLIELLVVIAVIAILMSLLIPVSHRIQITAKETAIRGQIKSLDTAIAAYELDFGVMPPDGLNVAATAYKPGGGTYTVSSSTALYYYLTTPFRVTPNAAKGEVWASKDFGPILDVNYSQQHFTGTGTEITDAFGRPLQYNNVRDCGFSTIPTTSNSMEIRTNPALVPPDPRHPANPAHNLQGCDIFSMGVGSGNQCSRPIANFKCNGD
jgi:prepilin-type N-terminal cleavage/methylation domain-containing protein